MKEAASRGVPAPQEAKSCSRQPHIPKDGLFARTERGANITFTQDETRSQT